MLDDGSPACSSGGGESSKISEICSGSSNELEWSAVIDGSAEFPLCTVAIRLLASSLAFAISRRSRGRNVAVIVHG